MQYTQTTLNDMENRLCENTSIDLSISDFFFQPGYMISAIDMCSILENVFIQSLLRTILKGCYLCAVR